MIVRTLAVVTGCLLLVPAALFGGDESSTEVRFNRDIRPILADACFACHGPDDNARQAELRLHTRDGLFAERDSGPVVSPSDLNASELYRRITSTDPAVKMPPPEEERQLSPEKIELLRRWIEQGAAWEGHWAFEPVRRPPVPESSHAQWRRNAIDGFIQSKLDQQQLTHSPQASPETLVRRVTLDLTGLPPTLEQIDAYLADTSPDRYERLVDRLLASPSYGEHMAVAWLDAARYADTSGYQTDGSRDMSRWRDWLIAALNAGKPYDEFTIEQLAGDLLPDPTLNQQIATGFHRNHRANSEGGSIPEEFLVEYVVDRVDTTGTVWLGLTIGCARCHDHKYDPISQKEYYELFAYFNTLDEKGRVWKEGNSPPLLLSPTPAQQTQLGKMDEQLAAAREAWEREAGSRYQEQLAWEQSVSKSPSDEPVDWTITAGLVARYPLQENLDSTISTSDLDPTQVAAVEPAQAAAPHISQGQAEFISGERPALRLDGRQFVDAGNVAKFSYFDSFTVSAWVKPRGDVSGGIVSRVTDDSERTGWALHVENGRVQVHLSKRWLDDALRVETEATLEPERWQHVMMTYEGNRVAAGVRIYVDGDLQSQRVLLDMMNQSMEVPEPLRIGSTGTTQPFAGEIADVRIYDRQLSETEAKVVATSDPLHALLRIPTDERTSRQSAKVREYYLREGGPDEIREKYSDLQRLREEREQFVEQLPTTMVMRDSPQPKPTAVLARGSYDNPTTPVSAGVPDVLKESPAPVGDDRLALARWLVDPSHPLTARVAVNREWQRFFGNGIVKTAGDFGTQGERPSHPDLLDWLADEFVRTGWDIKRLHRLIVSSAAYRQVSVASPEHIAVDPDNRLLVRGPRFRMTAEMIRDAALSTSGLLQTRLGGPSVKPYQPEGLWSEISSDKEYVKSTGPDLYRRSLYSFVKRTVVNPTYGVFDATTRETCIVSRGRTNTPLQALTLMNDVTFVEAARSLAERTLREGGSDDAGRLQYAFRLATARQPTDPERDLLIDALQSHRNRYRSDKKAAQQLLNIGQSQSDATLDPIELAAYTAVMNVLLNLDETVTKE